MDENNYEKMLTLFNAENYSTHKIDPQKIVQMRKEMMSMQHLYSAAIREISSKLKTLDEEFQILHSHNPIQHIESRLKSSDSIGEKLVRRGFPLTSQSVRDNITDIAGVRVVCHYIDDIYTIADLISKQSDIKVIRMSDYIKEPKPNGYRSLHIIATVPVYLSTKVEHIPVEIQIRTIAMDFWASLEHSLKYKSSDEVSETLRVRIKNCAESIAQLDCEMQEIHKVIRGV